jgi:two-component system CheB/CheR fusion protein
VNVIQNVNRLKESENMLKNSIEQLEVSGANLKEAEKIGKMGSWEKDIKSGDLNWSDELYRMYGLRPQSVKMTSEYYVNLIVHPDDRWKVVEGLEALYKKNIAKPQEYRIITPDGEKVVLSQAMIEKDEEGNVTKVRGIVRDVTQERIAENNLINLRLSQQKEILNAIMLAQEQERERIGEALHNGVAQMLYGIQILLTNIESQDSLVRKRLNELLGITKEAIEETRLISFELMPPVLKDYGITVALKTLLQRINTGRPKIDLMIKNLNRRLPENIEFALYRIIQELINNILKHSHATEATIEISLTRMYLNVTVTDNGKGFNQKEVIEMKNGIGLVNIKNRIELLDGELKIRSSSGKGTAVSIRLPQQV